MKWTNLVKPIIASIYGIEAIFRKGREGGCKKSMMSSSSWMSDFVQIMNAAWQHWISLNRRLRGCLPSHASQPLDGLQPWQRYWQEPTTMMVPKPQWHELLAFQARGWQSLLCSLNETILFKKRNWKWIAIISLVVGRNLAQFVDCDYLAHQDLLCSVLAEKCMVQGSLPSDPPTELPTEQFSDPQPTRKPRLC